MRFHLNIQVSFLIIHSNHLHDHAAKLWNDPQLFPFFNRILQKLFSTAKSISNTLNCLTEYSFFLTALNLIFFQKIPLFLIPFPQSSLLSHTQLTK